MVMMAALGTGAWAAGAGAEEVRTVTVCIGPHPEAPTWSAGRIASDIFSTIGVRLDWHSGLCPASPGVLQISFADRAPKGEPAGALAYASPYEGTHIVVLYERVRLQCGCACELLAYVLVHEITHMLEGISRHSESGIMKEHWDLADYKRIRSKTLAFAAADVELIHLGLDRRVARLAGLVRVAVSAR